MMHWLRRMIRCHRYLGSTYGRYYELGFIDVGSILALVGLVSVLIITAYLGTEKVSSDQAVAAMQQMRDQFADQVDRMTNAQHPDYESQPGYKVRIAQRQLDAADKFFRRVKNDEKVLLDKIGQAATKDALFNLIKGQIFTSDIAGAGDLAFGTTKTVSDAYSNTESVYQKRLRQKIKDLKNKNLGGPLQSGPTRDDLDFLIAAAELDHIVRQMEREGYDQNDPAFVNQINRYIENYYLQKDQAGLPPNIRRWLDTIRAAQFGGRGPDVPATGRFIPTEEDAAEMDIKVNTMSLTYNPAGGAVRGDGRVMFLVPPDEGCEPSRADVTLTFTGTYSLDSKRFGGTGTGRATGVNNIYNSETKQCVSLPGEESFKHKWEATLQGNKVSGTVTRLDSDSTSERFELTVQGQ